jgi:hypothetical protein
MTAQKQDRKCTHSVKEVGRTSKGLQNRGLNINKIGPAVLELWDDTERCSLLFNNPEKKEQEKCSPVA